MKLFLRYFGLFTALTLVAFASLYFLPHSDTRFGPSADPDYKKTTLEHAHTIYAATFIIPGGVIASQITQPEIIPSQDNATTQSMIQEWDTFMTLVIVFSGFFYGTVFYVLHIGIRKMRKTEPSGSANLATLGG